MRKFYLAILASPLLFVSSYAAERDAKDWPLGCRHVVATLVAIDAYPNGITKISINPDTVEIEEGCYFEINNPGDHDITTTPQDPTHTWLNGHVSTGKLLLGPAETGIGLFKYTIAVKDIGELDPRARVL